VLDLEEFVRSCLDELYAHEEWADAEHWHAFETYPPALGDTAICERLHHIHLVQHGFLWVTSPQRGGFAFKKLEDFPNMADLKNYGRQGLAEMNELLQKTDANRLEEVIEVPWYHRGQNATRLRELGGEPPMTDFIVWLRDGKPAARW
jgi:uncharacterized damage-inducible protein DinB